MKVEFLPCGDCALSVQFGERIERSLNERVIQIKKAVDAAGLDGLVETVSSYRALMVHYDPLRTSQAKLIDEISPFLDQTADAPTGGTHWRIPVCYTPEFAPDLEYVASCADMATERVIEIHTTTTHYVYMIGFAPGQPHMGDLPEELNIPRRKDPRATVEKGSIVTATGLSIIYPVTNASGWHIIGRSPVSVFDVKKEPPVLLVAGDTVDFYSVSLGEYHEIQRMIDEGRFDPEQPKARA
ncbi:MAG: 5-oxoprolinase subunit PxpB [Rhodospirillales bacterium]|jgi:inhibitor of KinA|nr:5-oxoprolinase subunit PxpB [Rhodospirillales bacterium]